MGEAILGDDRAERIDVAAPSGYVPLCGATDADLPAVAVIDRDQDADLAEVAPSARAVLIDMGGWPDGAIAAMLDQIGDEGALHDRLVVEFARDQLDFVAGRLVHTRVALLCDPSAAERAAALVQASGINGRRAHDRAGDEAERLAAIAQEVARIAEALGGLARSQPLPGAAGDRRVDFHAADASDLPEPPVTAAEVRASIRARRMRDAIFGPGWFEEPAWDMLLDLFAAELERARVSVSSLCIAAAVAQTTALRWITKMIAAGLLQRQDDPADRRRAFVTLGEETSRNMRRYFGAVQRRP